MGTKLMAGLVLAAGFGLLTLCAVTENAAAQGEGPPKPGAEHKVLEPLVGNFKAKIKMWTDPAQPASESEGMMVRKWIMNGLYLQEDFDGKFMGMDFKGMGLFGFDMPKKKYVGAWIDSFGTGVSTAEGTYNIATKTFNVTMETTDQMTGKPSKARETIRMVDNDYHLQEMFMTPEGGKEFKMMEIHYNRVKK